ncbi:MAG TPA: hypothetical protein VI603_09440 [Saprospiraceae bacterium]|nr:hypothetical protein [Saprospiraceae bacterium]
MKHLILSGVFTTLWLSVFAQIRAEYNGVEAIKEIHDGWLIVRLPGLEKKIAALDSLLSLNTLSGKARNNLEREKAITLEQQSFIHTWYPVVFDSVYTFSRYAFIYTHETAGFQNGNTPARSGDGAPLDSIYREDYFFATLNGVVGDPFHFTSKDHRIVSYPFPNNISKPGSVAIPLFAPVVPLWVASFVFHEGTKRRVYRHVVRLNRKLSSFYRRKYEKV